MLCLHSSSEAQHLPGIGRYGTSSDRLTRGGQQGPQRCRSCDRAAASSSAPISSQLDDTQELRTGNGTGVQLPIRAGEAGTCRRAGS
jgi:hypothetical protein